MMPTCSECGCYTYKIRKTVPRYVPLPGAVPFHESRQPVRIIVGDNRSGATHAAAAEVVKLAKANKMIAVVNRDSRAIADVSWRKLSGMIPSKNIAEIWWSSKRNNIPSCVKLANGCELRFFSSFAAPPVRCDVVWVDDKPVVTEWLNAGDKCIWSITAPGCDKYPLDYPWHDALRSLTKTYGCFVMTLADNHHIDDSFKEQFKATIPSSSRRARCGGQKAYARRKPKAVPA